jgi:hypothetical protein
MRLDTRVASSASPHFQIPWKALGLLVIIAGIWGYVAYKYVQYRVPNRTVAAVRPSRQQPRKTLAAKDAKGDIVKEFGKELELSPEQQEQLGKIAATTTSPREMRRAALKILSPEQRQKLAEKQKELARQRAEAKKQREERMRKYYGNDVEYARQANKAIAEQRAARLAANQQRTSATLTESRRNNP